MEIQGKGEDDFSARMFQYFYRIFDVYKKEIFTIVLFTDAQEFYKPNTFEYKFHGTELIYKFNTYKLIEQDETSLIASDNPFALAVLAGIYMINSKNDVNQRYQFKRRLFELVLSDERKDVGGFRDNIRSLLYFIDFLLEIPEEMTQQLQRELIPLSEKEASQMSQAMNSEPSPTLKGMFEMKKEEGKIEGKIESSKEIVTAMIKEGLTFELISKVTGLGIKEIVEIKDGL